MSILVNGNGNASHLLIDATPLRPGKSRRDLNLGIRDMGSGIWKPRTENCELKLGVRGLRPPVIITELAAQVATAGT
uniref:GG17047 n=1 Tax=Drosophila erecta TaxID=7220 RepID=B3P449_DROER